MLKFTETHEWAKLDDDIVTVGISEYAVEELGDIVFVDLPDVGDTVNAGEAFGEIESVKAASELMSPVDGEVTEVNDGLEDDFDVLKRDAYGEGWMVRIKASDPSQLDKLMDKKAYQEFTDNQ